MFPLPLINDENMYLYVCTCIPAHTYQRIALKQTILSKYFILHIFNVLRHLESHEEFADCGRGVVKGDLKWKSLGNSSLNDYNKN